MIEVISCEMMLRELCLIRESFYEETVIMEIHDSLHYV